MIRKGKGMSISNIMEETGVSWGATVYHLSVLEREGHSVSVRKGRERIFFPIEKPRSEYEKDAVLKNISTAQIYELIRQNPGIVQKYISDEMEMKHSSVYWHINRLKDTGLVREEKVGRNSQYFPGAKNEN
jgi:predicted transcriptional regulator